VAFPAKGWTATVRPVAPSPVLQVNLRVLGYTARATAYSTGSAPKWTLPTEGYRPFLLCFLNDDEVVVPFVFRSASSSLAKREKFDTALPLRLEVLVVSVAGRRVSASREWPVNSYSVHVLPAESGDLVLVTSNQLRLYSPSLQPHGKLSLPSGDSAYQYLYESPGARYVIIGYERQSNKPGTTLSEFMRSLPRTLSPKEHLTKMSEFIEAHTYIDRKLIDLRGPRVVETWTDRGLEGHWEITDDGTMLIADSKGRIKTTTHKGTIHVFCRTLSDRSACWGGGSFVSNDALFDGWLAVGLDRFAMRLVQIDGHCIFERMLPKKQGVWGVATSIGQRRFAVALNRGKGGSELFDIAPRVSVYRILVYDIPSRHWVYVLDARKEGIRAISGLALSPNGTLLALINQDGILEVFRLPGVK
jgi:hypothetical protein